MNYEILLMYSFTVKYFNNFEFEKQFQVNVFFLKRKVIVELIFSKDFLEFIYKIKYIHIHILL